MSTKRGKMWRARYRDEDGVEHAQHFPNKALADAWATRMKAAVEAGTHVDPAKGKITFTAFYAEWSRTKNWEHGTRLTMDQAARSATFKGMAMRRIKRMHVEAWVHGMLADGRAANTVRTRLANIRNTFRAAVENGVIGKDPSAGVKVTRPPNTEIDLAAKIPTPDEVRRLLDSAAPEFRAFIALCAFAGLRLGEAAGLKVADINFLHRRLSVERQVQRVEGADNEVREPKRGKKRMISLSDDLLTILSEHVRQFVTHPDGWLFTSADGAQPANQNHAGRRFDAARKASGVTGHSLHHLRHFYASGLISQGCEVTVVQRSLGHAKPSTTLDVYSHLWPKSDDKIREAVNRMADQVLRAADHLRTEREAEGL